MAWHQPEGSATALHIQVAPHYSALLRITPHYSALLRITPHYSALLRITPHYSAPRKVTAEACIQAPNDFDGMQHLS